MKTIQLTSLILLLTSFTFAQEFKKMVKTIEDLSMNGSPSNLEKGGQDKEKAEVPKGGKILIAIPTAGGKLCSHFGHCEQFALIQTENGQIKGKTMQTPPPHEPGILPKWLHDQGAALIIAGGMGAQAQELFNQNGIRVITGAPMDSPESLVNQYLSESLVTGDNTCDH